MIEVQTKLCRICLTDKSLSEFHVRSKNTDGRDSRCLACLASVQRKPRVKFISNQKTCTLCGENKSLDFFYKRVSRNTERSSFYTSRCKECINAPRRSGPRTYVIRT